MPCRVRVRIVEEIQYLLHNLISKVLRKSHCDSTNTFSSSPADDIIIIF